MPQSGRVKRAMPPSTDGQNAPRQEPSSAEAPLGDRQAAFDRRYRLLELKERRGDRDLKRQELEISKGRGFSFTSGQATVAAAVIALLSAILGGVFQGSVTRDVESGKNQALLSVEKLKADASIALEKQKQDAAERLDCAKFETTLILKATEAANRDDQIRNLKFFLNAGFIHDPDGKIAKMDDAAYPSLPPPTAKDPLSAFDDLRVVAPKISLARVPEARRPIAQLIIDMFAAAGFSTAQQVAAVAVAVVESNLNPSAISDGGMGYGLYSFHPDRQAAAMALQGLQGDRSQLKPETMIAAVISDAKRSDFRGAVTVVDAVASFTRRITRPPNPES
jgi:hypothetical protein